ESQGDLVEHDDPGVPDVGPRDAEHLLLTTGQTAGNLVQAGWQRWKDRERSIKCLARVAAGARHGQPQVLGDRERTKDTASFRNEAQSQLRPAMRWRLGHVPSIDQDPSRRWAHTAGPA